MKKIFYYLLPLFLLSQSGTAQQDSLTLRITDEKGQIIIGAVVLQYPESYLSVFAHGHHDLVLRL